MALMVALTMVAGCSGAVDPTPNSPASGETAVESSDTVTQDESSDPAASEPTKEESANADPPGGGPGSACATLDPEYLTKAMTGQKTTFGTDFKFAEPLNTTNDEFCQWKEMNTGMSLELTLLPTAETDTTDHSQRMYNLDSPPVAVPQDGPGTDAVLLTDTTFESEDLEAFAFGFFFVQGDMTAYVKSVGLSITPEFLRVIAEEVSRRLLAA